MVNLKFVSLMLLLFAKSESAHILGLMGSASHSQHLWNEVIFEELAAKGHHLTIVSVDVSENHHPNIDYIHLEETFNTIHGYFSNKVISAGTFSNMKLFYDYQMITCQGIVKSNGFKTAINLMEDEEFDLILYDMANGPCLIKFIEKLENIPVIGISASKIFPGVLDLSGGHNYPAYTPYFLSDMNIEMSFFQRAFNTALYFADYLYKNIITYPVIGHIVKDAFPESESSIPELENRLKLILLGTHSSIDHAIALPQNVIPIAGLHIQKPKPLHQDIEAFIEESKLDCVLISLGNSISDKMIGEERLNAIANVINRFPKLNFLWQLQNRKLLKKVPRNLLIRESLPQNDILAHPKIKAFLTNADSLSIQDATYHGVPLVTMPIFLDQSANAHQVYVNGVAETVDFYNINETAVFESIQKIIKNSSYADNQNKMSVKFKDRQNHPLDTAIWWIEYFIRNPNSNHLTSPSKNISYFKAHSLDMLSIIVIFLVIFIGNTIYILKQSFTGTKKQSKREKRPHISDKIKKTKIKTR